MVRLVRRSQCVGPWGVVDYLGKHNLADTPIREIRQTLQKRSLDGKHIKEIECHQGGPEHCFTSLANRGNYAALSQPAISSLLGMRPATLTCSLMTKAGVLSIG